MIKNFMQNYNKVLQGYVHFVQCIHKTHSQHVKKMQGNIRIVLTLSIQKKKRQCLLHRPGFQHQIVAAPAAAVVLFSCSIYYLSAGIAALTLTLKIRF